MKYGQLIIGLIVGGFLGYGLFYYFSKSDGQSQSPKTAFTDSTSSEVNWTWPDSLDAVKAAPENHKIVFEDSTVRILQVLLNGQKEEPIHTHRWKSIMWITKPAVPCRIYQYKLDKNKKFVASDSVTVPHMDTNIGYPNGPESPTGIKNLGRDNGIAYRVEFKKEFKP
ncbi:hypothetical protein [Pedobacter sp. Leaf176]|uniref:hypothetical protein n=1 Tax=Pedobacter sp. Leaf176 TaxID=1736286 RepID=UPI0006F23DE3|nr:hypothetical protein [Pedobacter sp. Leaf176]KQR70203.1 hypothetical protein ASF92_09390 [Pedobacter sp. Leaf176]